MDPVKTWFIIDHHGRMEDAYVTDQCHRVMWMTAQQFLVVAFFERRTTFTNTILHTEKFFQVWSGLWQKEWITNSIQTDWILSHLQT
jgi:hypothetical protein